MSTTARSWSSSPTGGAHSSSITTERVADYFHDRDDLLVMRVTEGDGYDLLCPFLGVPTATEPFPWSHKNTSITP